MYKRMGWPGAGKEEGDLLGSCGNDGSERHGVAWITSGHFSFSSPATQLMWAKCMVTSPVASSN